MTITHENLEHIYKYNIEVDLKYKVWECELDLSDLGQRQVAGSCEHGDESSGYISGREFLEHLSNNKLLNVNSLYIQITLKPDSRYNKFLKLLNSGTKLFSTQLRL